MIEQIKDFLLNILPVLISVVALFSNYKIGKRQADIGKLQSDLQEKQVEISKLEADLQKKQLEISSFQTVLQEKQVDISQMQIDFQNKVELYLFSGAFGTYQGTTPTAIPTIYIKNAGNNVVYLEKYDLNGREYPQNMFVLPPMSVCSDAYYHMDLPMDGTSHVSFKLEFSDWQNQKWQMKGYADFRNGIWELTYSPSEKRKEHSID